jgi:hypothetical protein
MPQGQSSPALEPQEGQSWDWKTMSRDEFSPRNHARQFIWAGCAVAVIAASVVGWTAYKDRYNYANWSDWVTHSQVVLDTLDEARANTFSAVIAVQALYQTGARENLDKLARIFSALQRESERLRNLTRDDAREQSRLDQVDRLITVVGALSRSAAFAASTQHGDNAIKAKNFWEISIDLYRLRDQLNQVSEEERRLFRQRVAHARISSEKVCGRWPSAEALYSSGCCWSAASPV